MLLKNDWEEESEEYDIIIMSLVTKSKLITKSSPNLRGAGCYTTMVDSEREGDVVNEGGDILTLYEVR